MRILFPLLLLTCLFGFTPEPDTLLFQLEDVEAFAVDHAGQVYVAKDDVLRLYTTKGQLKYQYSNKQLGDISSIDANNPLRILVYYNDLKQIVILDNTLSEQERIALDEMDFQQISLVCRSTSNSLWLYDTYAFELIRTDKTMQPINRSSQLGALLNDDLEPTAMIEFDEQLYLMDPKYGILIFDVFGTYIKTVPIKKASSFQPLPQGILYVKDGKMFTYNDLTLKHTAVKQFKEELNGALVLNGIAYLQSNNQLLVYKIEE